MTVTTLTPSLSLQITSGDPENYQHRLLTEEVEGLIKVYKDGHVERAQIVPCVNPSLAPDLAGVSSKDIIIDKVTNVWARFYVPNGNFQEFVPLIIYFHGGGFCVGSASWICYHDFLVKLSTETGCVIMSVNYRLAPENPLPAAYEDGVGVLNWVKRKSETKHGQNSNSDDLWWSRHCDFSRIFLAGDSAGANIAYHVGNEKGKLPLTLEGIILIQPFFSGERRTKSEKETIQSPKSALSLKVSDTYWRMALPHGSNRDHPWCNPKKFGRGNNYLVCVSEMDILRDQNLKICSDLKREGNKVEVVEYKGVGHGFQVLSKSQVSKIRARQMMSDIQVFIR